MSDLLELIHQMLESGLTWATGVSVVLMYLKWYEGKKKKAAYDRMERKIDAIGEKVGYEWNGQANDSEMDLLSYKRWQQSYLAGISQVGFLFRRRGRKMNKAWVITLVTYILSVVAAKWGIELPDGTPETIVTAITAIANAVMVLIPIVLAFLNKTKKPEVPVNEPRIYGESNK